jgi:hypothetical protein
MKITRRRGRMRGFAKVLRRVALRGVSGVGMFAWMWSVVGEDTDIETGRERPG